MKPSASIIVFILLLNIAKGQPVFPDGKALLGAEDMAFLGQMTRDVMESSRIYPGQTVSPDFGPNNSGGILIRPGGRDCYPSFWIRDYAMSLESGLVTTAEQKHMISLTAATQCSHTHITKGGSMIPLGAVADHIRIDDLLPIFFPGTYSYEDQGTPRWGVFPPYCDQYYFIHMVWNYITETSDVEFLESEIEGMKLIDRLELAYKVPPVTTGSPLVYTTDNLRGVDFGFRDAIVITGHLCFSSILKFKASEELAFLFGKLKDTRKSEKYRHDAKALKTAITDTFLDNRGMLRASTGKSSQPDVWSTALAVYLGIIDGDMLEKTCRFLERSYLEGTLAYKGNIRHILTSDDYSDSQVWEVTDVKKNTYQNGAYWGTPTGWVCNAIARVNLQAAKKLAAEYVEELRKNDYRKGESFGAPYECFHPSGYVQNPVYLTSVTCPYAVFKLNGR